MSGATEVGALASARVAASGVAGGLELCLFHPLDTATKRLMTSKDQFSVSNWRRVILQESEPLGVVGKIRSLTPGLSFGAAYKVTQRAYVWGGQPFVKEVLKKQFKPRSKTGKTLCDGLAGSMMGIGEVALLPLNLLKIKAQTNPEFRSHGVVSLLRQHSLGKLYAGWQWTVARNVPGSFALFGANAFVKEHVFGLDNHKDATFAQTTVSSTAGAVSSIIVACPFDVVKTRIQSGTFGNQGGTKIMKNIMQQEGVGGLFKGAAPKVFAVGPKLVFSFTIAQSLMARFTN